LKFYSIATGVHYEASRLDYLAIKLFWIKFKTAITLIELNLPKSWVENEVVGQPCVVLPINDVPILVRHCLPLFLLPSS